MKKIGIFAVTALLLLVACLIWGIGRGDTAAEPTGSLHTWQPPEMVYDPESLELRRRLMRWYNLNLCADSPEDHYLDTYLTMVPTSTGLLGYVELEDGEFLPVYPDGCTEPETAGFVHTMDSGFPAVGMGRYSVLTWSGGADGADDRFREGDMLWIYILDQVQAYRVESVARAEPDFSAWEGGEVCAFSLPDGAGEDVWVFCVAVNEIALNEGPGGKSPAKNRIFGGFVGDWPK